MINRIFLHTVSFCGLSVVCDVYIIGKCCTPRQSTICSPVYYTYIGRHASAHDTWADFHTTRMQGQYTSQNEHFTYTRISRSAYGVGILIVTCLHTSDERVARPVQLIMRAIYLTGNALIYLKIRNYACAHKQTTLLPLPEKSRLLNVINVLSQFLRSCMRSS